MLYRLVVGISLLLCVTSALLGQSTPPSQVSMPCRELLSGCSTAYCQCWAFRSSRPCGGSAGSYWKCDGNAPHEILGQVREAGYKIGPDTVITIDGCGNQWNWVAAEGQSVSCVWNANTGCDCGIPLGSWMLTDGKCEAVTGHSNVCP